MGEHPSQKTGWAMTSPFGLTKHDAEREANRCGAASRSQHCS